MRASTLHQNPFRRGRPTAFAFSALVFTSLFARGLFAQSVAAPPPDEPGEAIQMLEFFVQEKGVSRATNSITSQDTQIALPGVTVEKLLANVPGVDVTTTDPFGFKESDSMVRVRSFGITALAVNIDDVPVGNNSARYGTPAGRIVDNENLSTISVSQGTGDVTSPAYEALGGAIKYYTSNPKRFPALQVKQSIGTFDYQRWFIRADTGEILPGLTAFVSSSQMTFKTVGVPSDSEGRKIDAKIRYELPRTTLTYSFTWNDRDDYDTGATIRWDRWRALETGEAYAGYGTDLIYNATERANLAQFASLGYVDHRDNPVIEAGLRKNFSDRGRNHGQRDVLDSSVNLGDPPNTSYYYYARNGRMDGFSRASVDHAFGDALTGRLATYYQHKQYYGTAHVPRATAISSIRSAYIAARTAGTGIRDDIWPRYAYRDTAGNLVPFGTPGAIPVGFTDTNGNGFFDPGEKLDPSKTITEFTATGTNAHALITPSSTTLADATTGIPGATARDEDFGGHRWGLFPKFVWTLGPHRLTGGAWYEKDVQTTRRPTYNLLAGSPTGDFLYDQELFNNYTRYFGTETTMIFLEDVSRFLDDRLTITAGFKSLEVDRHVSGVLDGSYWADNNAQETRNVIYKDRFLPQAGISYSLTNHVELFGSYAVNIAAPNPDIIASNQFGDGTGLLPEKATNYDVGIRLSTPSFGATLAVFYNAYEERILSQPLTIEEQQQLGLAGFVGASIYRNVGGIDSTGAELSFDWRTPLTGLRLTGSVAYQNAEFKEDLRVSYASFMANPNDPRSRFYEVIPNPEGGTPQLAWELQKGKTQGKTPEFTVNLDSTYTWKNWDFNFGGRFYDAIWVNTLNTEKVPSYTIFRAGVTWRGERGTILEPFNISVRVDNLFDRYIWYASGGNAAFNGTVFADYGRTVVASLEAKF